MNCVPKNGFNINKHIQNALDIKFDSLKLNPVYDQCKRKIVKVKKKVATIETLEKNSDNYIYEFFEKVKRQFDLRREDVNLEIDTYSDEIIQSVESTKANCMKLSKEVNMLTAYINTSKKELTDLIERFDTLNIDEKKFGDIKCICSQRDLY